MSLLLGDMLVRFKADITDLTVKTAMAAADVEGFSGAASVAGMAIAGGLLIGAAAIVGIGTLSVKMAADFQQSMNLLVTSAGEPPKYIKMVSDGILQMSVDTATSTDKLAAGMFNISSAGIYGADGLRVLKVAAEGAKVENADLAAVTDVLTTAMHNYKEPASQAADVMNSFRLAASIGKMRMDDLTGAMKNVLPIASLAKVKLTDVEAALSTMSLSGDKGASAGTHLAQMLTNLLAPSSKATKELTTVGLTSQQIATEMKISLPGALEMITTAVGEKFPKGSQAYIAAISAISGGNKSMKAILMNTGDSMKDFIRAASLIGPTMKANSTDVDGWALVQKNFNFQMGAAGEAVKSLMKQLGTALLPVLGNIIGQITPLITGFMQWETQTHGIENAIKSATPFFLTMFDTAKNMLTPVIGIFMKFVGVLGQLVIWVQHNALAMQAFKVIAMILGGLIAVMFIVMIVGAIVVLGTLAIAIGLIVGVVMGVIWVFHHWGDIVGWLGNIWNKFVGWLSGLIAGVVDWFEKPIRDAINNVVGWFSWLYNHNYYFKMLVDFITIHISAAVVWLKSIWQTAVKWITDRWNELAGFANSAWQKVSTVFSSIWGTYISRPLGSLWNSISKWFTDLGTGALNAGTNFINMLVSGITSGAGAIWNAVSGIAGNIWKALGFHSPTEEGPGRTADRWMPALIDMLVTGLNTGAPKVGVAAQNVAAQIYPIHPSASTVATAASGSTSGGNMTIIIEENGSERARATMQYVDRAVRLKLGSHGRAA
jgi:TP901 family phage tail tape measure protein